MGWMWMIPLALASSNYPGTVDGVLYPDGAPTDCAIPCVLCHSSSSGGGGTVTAPFGVEMMAAGLTGGGQTDLLTQLLTERFADLGDVDGDGVTDESDLRSGVLPGGEAYCGDGAAQPQYGCLTTAPWWTGAWLLVVPLARRRRG